MNKILSSIFLIFFVSMLFVSCNKKREENAFEILNKKDEITVGVKDDSKPFGYFENNEFKGYDIDVANFVFNKLFEGKKIKFVAVDARNRITKLNQNEIDFIVATMSVTSARLKIVDFSHPYFVAGQAILTRKNSKIRTIDDLNGKNVAIVMGTTGERTIREFAPNVTLNGAKTYLDAFNMLKENKVEALYGDDGILYGIIDNDKDFVILSKRYTKEFYAIAFRKNENNSELKGKLNAIIEQMQQDGTLDSIKDKWIPKKETK